MWIFHLSWSFVVDVGLQNRLIYYSCSCKGGAATEVRMGAEIEDAKTETEAESGENRMSKRALGRGKAGAEK